jgi:hypothetical protein
MQPLFTGMEALVCVSPFVDTSRALHAAHLLNIEYHSLDVTAPIAQALSRMQDTAQDLYTSAYTAMIKAAACWAREHAFKYIITGEVLNQSSPTQTLETMQHLEHAAEMQELIIRPLSGGLLAPCRAEKEGLIPRAQLKTLEGGSRKAQNGMLEAFGIRPDELSYNICRLCDPIFSKRVRDMITHHALHGIHALQLLHRGRHFRLDENTKLVTGRNEDENMVIEGHAELYDLLLKLVHTPGPTGLLPCTAGVEEIRLAGAICARYGDVAPNTSVQVKVRSPRDAYEISVQPASRDLIEKYRI